jgi:hypothetical protein
MSFDQDAQSMLAGYQPQSVDPDVQVKAGFSDAQQVQTTEFIIPYHEDSTGAHEHIAISDAGNVVHDTTGSLPM